MADIPPALMRRVKEESGYRCAAPTCRDHPVDVHHIVDRADGGSDTFENLIALCGVHHDRYHITKDIPRQSIQAWKANLSLLNSRYGDLEQRLLRMLAADPENPVVVEHPMPFHFAELLSDGLIEEVDRSSSTTIGGTVTMSASYALTEAGHTFVERWKEAEDLDAPD